MEKAHFFLLRVIATNRSLREEEERERERGETV